jgi:hypothetical protein
MAPRVWCQLPKHAHGMRLYKKTQRRGKGKADLAIGDPLRRLAPRVAPCRIELRRARERIDGRREVSLSKEPGAS